MKDEEPSSSADESSQAKSDKRTDNLLAGLVNELRSVLSSLNQEKHTEPTPVLSTPEDRTPSQESPIEKPMENGFNSIGSEPLDSADTDFWKGNVLGWPSAPEDPPVGSNGEPPPSSPLTEGSFPFPDEDEPPAFSPPPPPAPPLSTPPAPPTSSPPQRENFAWEQTAEDLLPKAPRSPLERAAAPVPTPPEAPSPPKSAKETDEVLLEIPIPGTVNEKKPQPPPSKPDIRIACFYASGYEKESRQFVRKLKEAGQKSTRQLRIESVLIQDWGGESVDLPSWRKAAFKAKADVVFIVAAKNEQAVVRDHLSRPPMDGSPGKERLILREWISMPALYVDVVVELERGMNGQD